ncbi:MAG: pilin [Candidatus Spechtbacterales bacterium]
MRMSISKKTTFILLLSLFLTGFFVILNTSPASAQTSCTRCSNNYSFSYAEWTAVTACDPYGGEPVTYTQDNSCTGHNCGNGACENDGFNFETSTNCPSDCSSSTSTPSDTCQRCSLNYPGCWSTWDNIDDSDCVAPTTTDEISSVEYTPTGCTTGEPIDRRCAEGPACGRCSLNYPGCWAVWIDIDENGCTAPNSLNENITVIYTPAGCQSGNDFDRRCNFDRLNVNYPIVQTPNGPLDINSLYTGGNVTMATIVLFAYAASIWVAGILAFVALIYAGFIFILSGGNPGKRVKAKKQFTDVLWGLLVVLLVPVIMNYINPTSALLRDPNLLGVDGSDKEFQLPLFSQEGDFDMAACLNAGNTTDYCLDTCIEGSGDDSILSCSIGAANWIMSKCESSGTATSTCVDQCTNELISTGWYNDATRTDAESICAGTGSSGGTGEGGTFSTTEEDNMFVSCATILGITNSSLVPFSINSERNQVLCDAPSTASWDNNTWCSSCSDNGGDITSCNNYIGNTSGGCCDRFNGSCPTS